MKERRQRMFHASDQAGQVPFLSTDLHLCIVCILDYTDSVTDTQAQVIRVQQVEHAGKRTTLKNANRHVPGPRQLTGDCWHASSSAGACRLFLCRHSHLLRVPFQVTAEPVGVDRVKCELLD